VASLPGQIERVNKLISVKPVSSRFFYLFSFIQPTTFRYVGEIGDLVVGRISAVESKRWKCDISGQKVLLYLNHS
jgi:exosome complex component RRP4